MFSQPLRIFHNNHVFYIFRCEIFVTVFKTVFVAVSPTDSRLFFNSLLIRNFTFEYNVFLLCLYLDLGSMI